MTATDTKDTGPDAAPAPAVTVVFLVYNRLEELRISLQHTLFESDYDPSRVDVIVVDNASEDGSAEMVAAEFPQAQLIRRDVNCGVSGWNDGFAVATGDLVLVLDDDCYLPPQGLGQAIAAMREHDADLVSFSIAAADEIGYRFDLAYRTGLLTFWGCAALIRREVLDRVGGYDPEIFVWAHEVEFMMRFFDQGFRHLHLPEVTAVHMKDTGRGGHWREYFGSRAYKLNARHYAYVAAKHLRSAEALSTFVALLALNVRDGVRHHRAAFGMIGETFKGFTHGLRHRDAVRNREISRAYRYNFYSFASPWWVSRRPRELLGGLDPNLPPLDQRVPNYYIERSRYYPESAATLDF